MSDQSLSNKSTNVELVTFLCRTSMNGNNPVIDYNRATALSAESADLMRYDELVSLHIYDALI